MAENITSTEWEARNTITSIERRVVGGCCWALVKDGNGAFGCCLVPEDDETGEPVADDQLGEDDVGDRDHGDPDSDPGFWYATEEDARKEYEYICAQYAADEAPACRICGCTDDDCSGCIERTGAPCSWVEADLCSACVGREVAGG